MENPHSADHIVIGFDIKEYSKRSLKGQKNAQEVLDRCLEAGFLTKGKFTSNAAWSDGGDGGYMLLEGSAVDALNHVQKFYEKLKSENDSRAQDQVISIRAALNYGLLVRWESNNFGPRYTGATINNCARLLIGIEDVQDGQVVCSEEFLGRVNLTEKNVEFERLRDVLDKHGNIHKVYNLYRSPGFGIEATRDQLLLNVLDWENSVSS